MTSPSEWKIRKQLFLEKNYRNTLYYVENGLPKNMTNEDYNNRLNALYETLLDRAADELPPLTDKCKQLKSSAEVFKLLKASKKKQIIKSILSGIKGDSVDIDFVSSNDSKMLYSIKTQISKQENISLSDEDIRALYNNINNSFEFNNPLKEFIDYSAESFLKLESKNRKSVIDMLLAEMAIYEDVEEKLNDDQREIIKNIAELNMKEDKNKLNDLLWHIEASIEKHIIINNVLPILGKYLKEKDKKSSSALHHARFGRLNNRIISLSKVQFVFTSSSGIWTTLWPDELNCSNGKSKK